MIKIVSLFLIGMAVLAMFGRLRFPKIGLGGKRARGLPKPKVCPKCGRYNLRGGPCPDCKGGSAK